MRKKKQFFKIGTLVLLGIVLIWGVVSLFMVQKLRKVVFYYPDARYTQLRKEQRWLKLSSREYPEVVVLTREYLLGPVHYYLRKGTKGNFTVKNIFIDRNILILDFQKGFSAEILSDEDGYAWLLRGLLKTLSKNTKVEKVIFLEEGQKILLNLENRNLAFPIPLKP